MTTAVDAIPVESLRHCRAVTRRRARNFYYGLKLLPEPKRSALYAIYAWMRRADDIADDTDVGEADRLQRLHAFGRFTELAIAGEIPDEGDLLWPAVAFTAQRFDLTPVHFRSMLAGQQDDLESRQYDTFADLREYCERVASSVGLVCIQVWGYDDDRAPALAVDRGIAFQLTNIIRDYAEDFDEGRVYLPAEDFRRHGLTPADLRGWRRPAACRILLGEQIERARGFYASSAGLEAMIAEECRPTLWAMTSIYAQLLAKAAANPADVMSGKRIRLRSVRKAAIAVRARWMLRGAGSCTA
jgi:phytoene synthase